jgi:hypothetical protein
MRLVFNDIEAASPEKAACIAGEKHFDDCNDWSDCEGENLSALVDYAPHEGVVIDFEAGRLRAHGPKLIAVLNKLLPEIDSEIEQRKHGGNAEDWAVLQVLSDEAHAAVREAQGNGPPKTITVHVEGGMVQDVTGIPAGCEVRVEDYDHSDDTQPTWDQEKQCHVTVYGGDSASSSPVQRPGMDAARLAELMTLPSEVLQLAAIDADDGDLALQALSEIRALARGVEAKITAAAS